MYFKDYFNSKQKDKQYTDILIAKLENSNQNFAYPRLVLSGFDQQSFHG